jgi:DNA-binding NtrC family response regulator
MSVHVLVVDDERSAQDLCADILEKLGCTIEVADSSAHALAILHNGHTDIVLTDVRMPGMSGIELLKTIKQSYPEIDVVVMTGFGTIPDCVAAMKLGAYNYITKPFAVAEFEQTFRRLIEKKELGTENRLLHEQIQTRCGFGGLIGTSDVMQNVFRLILKAAPTRHPVFILGESGTGKELVARAIHAQSHKEDNPFVAVDCGALSPTLIESELFGHVRGAFTGASQARQGLLASAQSGTVFLDEIAELSIELQTKLLRALQERQIRRIGGNEWTRFDARIIAATNQNVSVAIARGSFRTDLYFRLNVLAINIPPLREHKSDIPALIHYFIDRYSQAEHEIVGVSDDAMANLMTYNWPGNIRELENCVQRALVLGSGRLIHRSDLPEQVLYLEQPKEQCARVERLKELEQRAIVEALHDARGNPVKAAKMLGIGKTTIYRKLREYALWNRTHPS